MVNYRLGLYEKSMPGELSIPEKLREAKKAGFDYMELSVDETDAKLARLDWSEEEIQAVRRAQDEVGIPISSICLSGHRKYPLGHPDPAVQARSLEIMEKAIILAARLGARIIQLAGYDVYYETPSEETRANFQKNLRRCVEMAAQYGVILAFETMETEFMNTVEKAMKWVNEMQSPYLQVYPDMGNITNAAKLYGGSVLDDMETGRGHLAAIHLKESKPGIFREVPFGEGHVDFPAVAGKGLAMGVRMFVGEFWYVGQENWREVLEHNQKFLRAAIEKGAQA